MPGLNRRLDAFTESVIRRMTRVANEHGAINLSQGFPDFDPPRELMEALREASMRGPHQYAITWGASGFREALARKQSRFTGLSIDPDLHIVVTCGATEAMMSAMMAVCEPGDRVIVFSPFYENYAADAILSGAIPVHVPLRPPLYDFDPAELKRAFETRPKALILCNPANPTGKVFSRQELLAIAELAEQFDAFVITDEVYEHIVYAPHRHTYFSALPGMFERTISCSALSKTYSITGWRIGYVIAPQTVIGSVRKVHDFLTVGAAAPLQEAAVTALRFPDSYYEELAKGYTERRRVFLGALDDAGLSYTTPQGAYYVMVDVSELSRGDDVGFCEWMAREVRVAGVPGSSFFHEDVHRYVRFHFAKQIETLREAGGRLKQLTQKAGARRTAGTRASAAAS
jgi:aminotransferase